MYQKILVALENGPADESLIPHIIQLAQLCHSRLLLVHVADGWAARHYDRFKLSDSKEIIEDRAYLEAKAVQLRAAGLTVDSHLAMGEPPSEIVKTARNEGCDLIAMTSHGHRLIGDILFGSTIDEVRHSTSIPMLVVRANKAA
jgi:nucleotide-binding universal stress UspA family protein